MKTVYANSTAESQLQSLAAVNEMLCMTSLTTSGRSRCSYMFSVVICWRMAPPERSSMSKPYEMALSLSCSCCSAQPRTTCQAQRDAEPSKTVLVLFAAVGQLFACEIPKVSALASAACRLSARPPLLSTVPGDVLPRSSLDGSAGESSLSRTRPALSGTRPLLCCKAGCCSGEGA